MTTREAHRPDPKEVREMRETLARFAEVAKATTHITTTAQRALRESLRPVAFETEPVFPLLRMR